MRVLAVIAAVTLVATLGGPPLLAAEPPAPEKVFDLVLEKGKPVGGARVVRVTQGDAVRLRWMSDTPGTLHMHGYNIEQRLEPGVTAATAFTAHAAGRFKIYLHVAGAPSTDHHHAPVATVEVRPK